MNAYSYENFYYTFYVCGKHHPQRTHHPTVLMMFACFWLTFSQIRENETIENICLSECKSMHYQRTT